MVCGAEESLCVYSMKVISDVSTVFRMWGGELSMEEIAMGLTDLFKGSSIKDYET